MKNDIKIYGVWILIVANLLFQESWGLNILLITSITIVLMALRHFYFKSDSMIDSSPNLNLRWAMGALLWFIASLSVFMMGGDFQIALFLVTGFYFISLQTHQPVSLVLGSVQTLQSSATGLARIGMDAAKNIQKEGSEGKVKRIRTLVLIFTGIGICFAFLKLYQAADSEFKELTAFINLDWISWNFIFFYLFLIWIGYGIYFFKPEPEITKLEESLSDNVSPTYADRLQQFFGIGQEQKLALITLSFLSLMLLLLLGLDVYHLCFEYSKERALSAYSDSVHTGIYALIFSLLLVIVLISWFFRGGLNFIPGKILRNLGLLWLILNCFLVITTGLKNYEYILAAGLTYKRLGVMLYLIFCAFGLMLAIQKLIQKRSIWFLLRRGSVAVVFSLSVLGLFNWNSWIASYNLSHIPADRVDLEYLFELGPETYPALLDFHISQKKNHSDLFYRLVDAINYERVRLEWSKESSTWRSLTFREEWLYDRLSHYEFQKVPAVRLSSVETSIN